MPSLSLSILEIIVLMVGAVFLGITIHFYIVSRRSLRRTTEPMGENRRDLEQWKSRYFNDMEVKEKELVQLKRQLAEVEQNGNINSIESEELRKQNKTLQLQLESLKNSSSADDSKNFMSQLKLAQESLFDQNETISLLLEKIGTIRENEDRLEELTHENETLAEEIDALKQTLAEKEREISQSGHKQALATEMSSMLDNAYQEFSILQEKIQKLESQVSHSKMHSLDYENLKESHNRLLEELDAERHQLSGVTLNNKQLQLQLTDAESKLREANFQRQQLQKRVSYLEELTKDMQLVAETNKKLQLQLRRIGELESMINVIAEERDQLRRQATN